MKTYRVSVRFYPDRGQEKKAIDFLKQLPEKKINRFIVDAVSEKIKASPVSLSAGDLDAIREIIKDELSGVTFAAPVEKSNARNYRTDRGREHRQSGKRSRGYGRFLLLTSKAPEMASMVSVAAGP